MASYDSHNARICMGVPAFDGQSSAWPLSTVELPIKDDIYYDICWVPCPYTSVIILYVHSLPSESSVPHPNEGAPLVDHGL